MNPILFHETYPLYEPEKTTGEPAPTPSAPNPEEKKNPILKEYDGQSIAQLKERFKGKAGQYGQGSQIYSTISPKTVEDIIGIITKKKNVDSEVAMVLITGLAQSGGANKNSNCSYKALDATLSAHELLQAIQTVQKEGTNRQFFRCIRDQIAEIATALEEEGDLAGQLRLEMPTATLEEAVWCSSFQTTNPKCPENTRKWLVHNHQKRFGVK
mmetsp:Transcript_12518/g.32319  ORF Transcript_12518/g.32319 Transcript_12518/m.32319 type:complete len:213 (-) Transcript_12518:555-1193(-)